MDRDRIGFRILVVVVLVLLAVVLYMAIQLDRGQNIGGIFPEVGDQTETMTQETEEADATVPMETEEMTEATEVTEATAPTEDTAPEETKSTVPAATKPSQNSGATGSRPESTTPPATEAPTAPPATEAPTVPPVTETPSTPPTEGSDEASPDKIEGDMGVEDSIF